MVTLRQAAVSGMPFQFEARILTALGTTKSVRVVGDAPRPNLLRGFITDCTLAKSPGHKLTEIERKALETEREDAEIRHRELFEGVPLPVISYDWFSRRILDVNQQAVDHYGYSKDEFLRMLISELWCDEIAQESDLRLNRMDPTKPSHVEERHVRKDGTVIEVDVSSHVISMQRKPVRVLVVRDITDRNRFERDLQVSNERLKSLTRVTGAVIGSLPLAEQVQLMAEQVRVAFNVDACVVRLIREDELYLLANVGVSFDLLPERIPCNVGLPARVMREGAPITIFDTRDSDDMPAPDPSQPARYTFVSYAGAPLTVKDRIIGVIGVFMHAEPKFFSNDDLAHL